LIKTKNRVDGANHRTIKSLKSVELDSNLKAELPLQKPKIKRIKKKYPAINGEGCRCHQPLR